MIYHCLFEQSGTFKREFMKLGYAAIDYDIRNDFGETDIQKDLFQEIENAYTGKGSIFDLMDYKHDFVLAFFPCVRFEDQVKLLFRGDSFSQKRWDDARKLEYDLSLHRELSNLYEKVTQLAIVCLERKLPLVIENPYSAQHYLTNYWCIRPKVVELDRSLKGDYYKKPTQFWFINCEPKNNMIFEPSVIQRKMNVENISKEMYDGIAPNAKVARSMIAPEYANRFIREYILDEKPIRPEVSE